jgi:putative transposase
VKPSQKRPLVEFLRVGFKVSTRRACRVVGVPRTTNDYRSKAKDQSALRIRIRDLAQARVRYGYRRLHVLLLREGWKVNHKRVYRLYKEEGLSLRLKSKKKRVSVSRVETSPPQAPNEVWSMDFVSDSLGSGQAIRALTLVDNFSRVSPAIEVDYSLTGRRVVEVLERVSSNYGRPQVIKCDNGPEFISRAVDERAYRNGVKLEFSRPGKPTDKAYIESFNGRMRQECLDQHWFETLEEARGKIEQWRVEYNQARPHSALGNKTPEAFKRNWQQARGLNEAEFLTL